VKSLRYHCAIALKSLINRYPVAVKAMCNRGAKTACNRLEIAAQLLRKSLRKSLRNHCAITAQSLSSRCESDVQSLRN
jgi:hypothetical protein